MTVQNLKSTRTLNMKSTKTRYEIDTNLKLIFSKTVNWWISGFSQENYL